MAQAHVDYLNSTVRDELIKASVAMYKAQPENKHKFLAEYFAKLSAERESAPVEEKKQQKPTPAPKKKKAKLALSDVIFEITPDTDVEFDWEKVQTDIADIKLAGVLWASKFSLVPFVFGLQKLSVIAQIVNAKVPTTSVLVEAIKTVHGVGGCEMQSIETAGGNWEAEGHGRVGTTAPPTSKGKKGQQQQQSKKSKKKKKKGKKVEEGPRVVTPEMIKKDAEKIKVLTKEADYYVCTTPEMDGSAQTDVSVDNLKACLEQVRAKCPEVAIMMVAGGCANLTAIVDVPASKAGKVSAIDWLESVAEFRGLVKGDANTASAEYVCNADKGEFPIKMKDSTSASAFSYLKKMKVLDDGEEEVFYSLEGDDGY